MDDGWGRSPADNMVPDRDGDGITLWLQGLDWTQATQAETKLVLRGERCRYYILPVVICSRGRKERRNEGSIVLLIGSGSGGSGMYYPVVILLYFAGTYQ